MTPNLVTVLVSGPSIVLLPDQADSRVSPCKSGLNFDSRTQSLDRVLGDVLFPIHLDQALESFLTLLRGEKQQSGRYVQNLGTSTTHCILRINAEESKH